MTTITDRHLARIRRHLAHVVAHGARAEREWAELEGGIRSGTGGRAAGIADPTGEAATTPSPAREARRRYLEALERAEKALEQAAYVASRWAAERPARAEELQRLEMQADPGCEVVARIVRPDGSRWWEPEHRTTDLGGLLPRPFRLGRWAYDFARRTGRLPSEEETRAHLEGRRVRVEAP